MKLKKKLTGRTKLEKLMVDSMDDFHKECVRYGKIIDDINWNSEDGEFRFRLTRFLINDMIGIVKMRNGEVTEVGVTVQYDDIPKYWF